MLESPQLMAWESLCASCQTCFPPFSLHLTFQSAVPGLTRFTPEVYTAWPKSRTDILDFSHVPPPQSDWKAIDVLREEIVKNAHGTTDKVKAIQPTWLLFVANVSTIGVKAAEVGASDGPTSSPHASHSPIVCKHLILQSDVVRRDLLLRFDIHKVPDPAYLPLAPVPGLGAHQAPAAWAHHDWALAMSLSRALQLDPMLDLKRLQKAVQFQWVRTFSVCTSPEVVPVQGDDEDTAAGGEDAGHSEDGEALSQGTSIIT